MATYSIPGVYREDVFPGAVTEELPTGVPAILGLIRKEDIAAYSESFVLQPLSASGLWLVRRQGGDAPAHTSGMFTVWQQFENDFGVLRHHGYLVHAVRGFFENGGSLCYVQLVCFDDSKSPLQALTEGLERLKALETIDLICAPDIMWRNESGLVSSEDDILKMQAEVMKHCETLGDRFAILDSLPGADVSEIKDWPAKLRGEGVEGVNGSLYYPWVWVPDGLEPSGGFVPSCGYVAGVYARSDQKMGVHKAPANEVLEGVLDLEVKLTNTDQGELNPQGINCLRAFPGRGIRVWGARTLAGEGNNEWKYVNVRRLFLTAGRWIERNMASTVFELNDPRLLARISRELSAYFTDLFQRGALKGRSAQQAFRIKCDDETNPPEVRNAGMVVTEIHLAPTVPGEFIIVRIIHGAGGVTVTSKPLSTPGPVTKEASAARPARNV